MNSEDMMLGEIGHSQMDKYTDYIYTYIIYIYIYIYMHTHKYTPVLLYPFIC